ncbi:hypothetical protein XENOCAPTIV_008109 [Xenoophorus captivus]|uniref:TXNDC16 N-terminal domain-containing protein n=1 Tax=Xenoophorus captivus TaxID=1517983 RepID=A0ABV0QV09_9TELE
MSNHIEYTAADFYERLLSGKMMFLYFKQQVSPTISLFLVELEKSAEALQDYGVLVGKVTVFFFIMCSPSVVSVSIKMGVVDCGEWTDLCAAQPGTAVPFQPITAFPSVLLIRPQQSAQHYGGLLTGEALHRFIMM